jgi:hypothetical protein
MPPSIPSLVTVRVTRKGKDQQMQLARYATLVLGIFLAACGGGGGGSPAAVAPTVTITAANQGTVTRATIDGTQALGASKPLEQLDRATAQSLGNGAQAAGIGALRVAIRRAVVAAFLPQHRATIASAARPAATGASIDSCETGGSVTTTLNDADNSLSVSSGDSLSLTFTQCTDAAGDTVNGTMAFTIGTVTSAAAGNVQFSGGLAFQHVSVTSGTRSAEIDGSVGVGAAITATSFQLALTVGASALTVDASAPGYLNTIVYDPDMRLTVATTEGTVEQTQVTLDGSFTASSIGGRVLVSTVQPVRQIATDAFPSSGQVVVTGATGTHLRVTALDATQVQLELDADGDGVYERSGVLTWSSLGTT